MKRFFIWSILFMMLPCVEFTADAQSFLQMLNQSLNNANRQLQANIQQQNELNRLNQIINNPSLQSADMQSYMAFCNAGVEAASLGKHDEALAHFTESRKIAARTSDTNLKKLYNQYGWKDNLDAAYQKSYTQFKIAHPGEPIPGQASSAPAASSGYAAPAYTPTQHANSCGVCSHTGKCSNCNGSGISPYSHSICGACGGSGRCATCNGTGISGYSYY